MKKGFPLDKILTISAAEWVQTCTEKESDSVDLGDYVSIGVHNTGLANSKIYPSNIIHSFAELVPPDAEVVVDYRVQLAMSTVGSEIYYVYSASGTALRHRIRTS